jgi:hypothetical protein
MPFSWRARARGRGEGESALLELAVGEAMVFPLAVGLDQANFVRPPLQRFAERRPQRRV